MILEANKLLVQYRQGFRKQLTALGGIDLSIEEGEIFGLLGPNGAGKSTAMYCFLGLIQPNGGTVRVCDQQPGLGAPLFEDVVYLPEEPHYHPYMTVMEALSYYAQLYRRSISSATMAEALERVGLEEFGKMRVLRCSKGMKQKLGLAACMLFQPRVMFLDEPTRGLDPVMVRSFRDYLLEINRKGCTVILNSHVLSEVELVCKRVAILNKGKVIAHDRLDDLVATGTDTYEIVVYGQHALPVFATNIAAEEKETRGVVPEDKLEETMAYLRSQNIRLRSCRVQQESLEDVFMRILGGQA